MTAVRAILALGLVLGACMPDLPQSLGGQCDLNSDCETPLVCRIGYCRKECTTSRDCALGLDCVYDNDGLGACQLPSETMCVRDSDCPEPLVCTEGECTNECACEPGAACRDCPPGAQCTTRPDGTRACLDVSMRSCIWNSDCRDTMTSFVCAADQRCRLECLGDGDCRYGERCTEICVIETIDGVDRRVTGSFCVDPLRAGQVRSCDDAGVPEPDAGVADAGAPDAGTDDEDDGG